MEHEGSRFAEGKEAERDDRAVQEGNEPEEESQVDVMQWLFGRHQEVDTSALVMWIAGGAVKMAVKNAVPVMQGIFYGDIHGVQLEVDSVAAGMWWICGGGVEQVEVVTVARVMWWVSAGGVEVEWDVELESNGDLMWMWGPNGSVKGVEVGLEIAVDAM